MRLGPDRDVPIVIGIAGPSGSGKSTLARDLTSRHANATLLAADRYYRDLSHLSSLERDGRNFDHPDSIEHELLLAHLAELDAGNSVRLPRYDFVAHVRQAETDIFRPNRLIVLEGIFVLHWTEVRERLDLSVYVDLPLEICLGRRLDRDRCSRGRSARSIRDQFERDVAPMAREYVLPSARHADVIVDGRASNEAALALVDQRLAALRSGSEGCRR